MNTVERRKNILECALRDKSVMVDRLDEDFGVSIVTIRYDLKCLYINIINHVVYKLSGDRAWIEC